MDNFWFGFFLGFLAGIMFIAVACWLGVLLFTFKDWLSEKIKKLKLNKRKGGEKECIGRFYAV